MGKHITRLCQSHFQCASMYPFNIKTAAIVTDLDKDLSSLAKGLELYSPLGRFSFCNTFVRGFHAVINTITDQVF